MGLDLLKFVIFGVFTITALIVIIGITQDVLLCTVKKINCNELTQNTLNRIFAPDKRINDNMNLLLDSSSTSKTLYKFYIFFDLLTLLSIILLTFKIANWSTGGERNIIIKIMLFLLILLIYSIVEMAYTGFYLKTFTIPFKGILSVIQNMDKLVF